MQNIGLFFPIMVGIFIVFMGLFALLDKLTEPKTSYEKWLEIELARNPDYINWLKTAQGGKDYKLGRRILRRIKR